MSRLAEQVFKGEQVPESIKKYLIEVYFPMSTKEKKQYKAKLISNTNLTSKIELRYIEWFDEAINLQRSKMIRKGMKEKRDKDIQRVSNYLGISSDDIKKIHYTYEYYVITMTDKTKKVVKKKEVA